MNHPMQAGADGAAHAGATLVGVATACLIALIGLCAAVVGIIADQAAVAATGLVVGLLGSSIGNLWGVLSKRGSSRSDAT